MNPWDDLSIAPNGKPVQDNFQQWFGKSKVVGKDGLPLRMFHGTTAAFDRFDPELSNLNTGTDVPKSCMFFSSSPDAASSYAGQKSPELDSRLPNDELYNKWLDLLKVHGPLGKTRDFYNLHKVACEKEYKPGGNVMAVYLSCKKLLKVNAKGDAWNNIRFENDDWSINYLAEHARLKGYDGLWVKNLRDRQEGAGPPADTCVVFSPDQVKSSLGNSGLYLKGSASLDDQEAARQLRASNAARAFVRKSKASGRTKPLRLEASGISL